MLTSRANSPDCEYPVLEYKQLLDLVEANNLDLDEDELQQVSHGVV